MTKMRTLRHAISAGLSACLLVGPIEAGAQMATRGVPLTVDGYSGQVPMVQVNGRSYVDLEALARITNASIRLQGNRIILALPGGNALQAAATSTPPQTQASPAEPSGFSRDFVTSSIAALSAIRDWRATLVFAVQNNQPVSRELTSAYRRSAESQVALAAAASQNSQDKGAAALLQNELSNLRTLNANYIARHDAAGEIRTDAMDTDPLSVKVMNCMGALSGITVGGQFQDVTSCH